MARKNKPDAELVAALSDVTDFDAQLVDAIAKVGRSVGIPEGWSIIMESTPADSAYILIEGSVEIRKGGKILGTLGPGDVFGEIALVNHRLRSASVVAVSHVRAIRLSDEAIAELLDHDAGFADRLRAVAQDRIATD